MSMNDNVFQFKQFKVSQEKSAMKVNTDSILLSSWVKVSGCKRILDIGTGTGLIALMMAQRNAEASIEAVEIDRDAYEEAMSNFANSKWSSRLTAFHTPIQDFDGVGEYDLIICNPPFFTGGTLSENQNRNSVRHTLKLPNNELLTSARKHMNINGLFAVVLPYLEGLRFIEMAKKHGFYLHRKTEVLPRVGKPIERLLIELGRTKCAQSNTSTITIYADQNTQKYSKEYIQLTQDFYLLH